MCMLSISRSRRDAVERLFTTPSCLGPNFVFGGGLKTYEVKVMNITKGQAFTPVLVAVATHRDGLEFLHSAAPDGNNYLSLAAMFVPHSA